MLDGLGSGIVSRGCRDDACHNVIAELVASVIEALVHSSHACQHVAARIAIGVACHLDRGRQVQRVFGLPDVCLVNRVVTGRIIQFAPWLTLQ